MSKPFPYQLVESELVRNQPPFMTGRRNFTRQNRMKLLTVYAQQIALILVVAAAILLTSCDNSPPGASILALQTQINASSNMIVYLAEREHNLLTNSFGIETRLSILERARNVVVVDPSDPSFSVCETADGKLYVSTARVEPYLDGVRVHLSIGNPQSADFNNLEVHCHWSPFITTNDWTWHWGHESTNTLLGTFAAGSWHKAEISLLPCTTDELKGAQIEFFTGEVGLHEAPKEP